MARKILASGLSGSIGLGGEKEQKMCARLLHLGHLSGPRLEVTSMSKPFVYPHV